MLPADSGNVIALFFLLHDKSDKKTIVIERNMRLTFINF